MKNDIRNDIRNIFGDMVARTMESMVGIFKKANMGPEHIAEILKDLSNVERAGIHISALSIDDEETAEKIEKAINILRERRIEAFKKAVAEGRESEFLSAMNWTEKISLKVDMGLSRLGIPSEKPLTEENQRYLDILEQSIDKDIEQEAFSQGFSSVEEWQEYNSSKMESEIEEEIEPEMESDMISIFSRKR